MSRRLAVRCLGLVLLLAVAACGTRVTTENFDRIENGMSREAVIELLGEPDELSSMAVGGVAGTTARWEGGGRVIIVLFADGEVVFKSFGRAP